MSGALGAFTVNPYTGAAITATLNTGIALASGRLPQIKNFGDFLQHTSTELGWAAATTFGAKLAALYLSKLLGNVAEKFSSYARNYTVGSLTQTVSTAIDDFAEGVFNAELVVSVARRGASAFNLANSFRKGLSNKIWDKFAASSEDLALMGGSLDDLRDVNYVYRALTNANAETFAAGQGIFAKNPNGIWTLEEHLIRGSSPKSFLNDPWIATSVDMDIAQSFSSGNGIVRIDLSQLSPESVKKSWLLFDRTSSAYHFSIWQREISIFQHIPHHLITLIK